MRINFPFYADSVDPDIPDPRAWEEFGVGDARGSTAYVLRTATPLHFTTERLTDLIARGEFELARGLRRRAAGSSFR